MTYSQAFSYIVRLWLEFHPNSSDMQFHDFLHYLVTAISVEDAISIAKIWKEYEV